MPQVSIPGVGIVHFPYDMPPDQMAAAAKRLHDEAQAMAQDDATPDHPLARVGRGITENLPTIGAAAGGLVGGIPGAVAGGALGSAGRSGITRIQAGLAGGPKTATFEDLLGDTTSALTAGATEGGVQAAGAGVAKLGGLALRPVGRALYGKALAPSAGLAREFPDLVETGIREGFNVTPAGRARAGAARAASAAEGRALVRASPQAGLRVKPARLTEGLDPLRAKVANLPEANVATGQIGRFEENLLASHPKAKTLEELLDFKQGAQREASAAYKASQVGNRSAGIESEANKAVATRARAILEGFVPESRAANTRTQSLMGIERAIGKATERQPTGRLLGTGVVGLGALAHPAAIPAAAATFAATSPRVLGRLGIMGGRAGQGSGQIPANALRAALLAALDEESPR